MKLAFSKHKLSWFVVFLLAAILAIVACNAWLLCCGRCVISDFLRVPPIGWAIIAANLVAVSILFFLKKRTRSTSNHHLCSSCHSSLRDQWPYCPTCGSTR